MASSEFLIGRRSLHHPFYPRGRKASARTRRQRGSATSAAVSASGNPVRPHSHPGTCHAPTNARREACPAHRHSKPEGVWQEHKPPTMRHGRDMGWSASRQGQHPSAARTRSRRVTSHLGGSPRLEHPDTSINDIRVRTGQAPCTVKPAIHTDRPTNPRTPGDIKGDQRDGPLLTSRPPF